MLFLLGEIFRALSLIHLTINAPSHDNLNGSKISPASISISGHNQIYLASAHTKNTRTTS